MKGCAVIWDIHTRRWKESALYHRIRNYTPIVIFYPCTTYSNLRPLEMNSVSSLTQVSTEYRRWSISYRDKLISSTSEMYLCMMVSVWILSRRSINFLQQQLGSKLGCLQFNVGLLDGSKLNPTVWGQERSVNNSHDHVFVESLLSVVTRVIIYG